jgi:putative transposase
VTSLCGLLGKSKQAYYKHEDTAVRKVAEEAFCVEFIKEIRARDPGIGGPKLWQMYRRRFGREHGVGYNRFYDIIEKYDLKVRKKRRRVQTTNSKHDYPTYPDLTRMLIPMGVNQLWVSDITYIPFWLNPETGTYDFCYLSLITDYYSKEIIGYSVGPTLETRYSMEALEMAVRHVADVKALVGTLIHHSDRGVQYASLEYTGRLKELGIRISMTESGDPKDNAVAERVNNTIKNELLKGMEFTGIGEVAAAVKAAVDFYNNERPHMSLDGMTPSEASLLTGEIRKRWTSYREKAIKEAAA